MHLVITSFDMILKEEVKIKLDKKSFQNQVKETHQMETQHGNLISANISHF